MANRNGYRHEPDYAVPPGETLQETLDALDMDQKELALRTGLSQKTVSQIINGKHPLSQQTAIKFGRVTGVPASIWNNLEMLYQQRFARQKDRERLENDLQWLKRIPVKELINRGYVSDEKDRVSLLKQVLTFFGVDCPESWEQYWKQRFAYSFRRSRKFDMKPGPSTT